MSKEIVFSYSLILTVPPSTYYSTIKENLQPTSTTIFDKPLHSNVDVNNVTIFIAYYVGHHVYLLASEDFYHLSTFLQKIKKSWNQEFSDEEALVVKILYNEKWEIGTVNTTNICATSFCIPGFKLSPCSECCMLSSG